MQGASQFNAIFEMQRFGNMRQRGAARQGLLAHAENPPAECLGQWAGGCAPQPWRTSVC